MAIETEEDNNTFRTFKIFCCLYSYIIHDSGWLSVWAALTFAASA